MESAIGSPKEFPKIYRADCSQYIQSATAASRCSNLIMGDESRRAYKQASLMVWASALAVTAPNNPVLPSLSCE